MLSRFDVEEKCVQSCIKKIRATLSVGPDGILSTILKTYHDIFTPGTVISIQQLLKAENLFFLIWKVAVVVPVLKSGNKSDVCQCRPISPFLKPFEMVVYHFKSATTNFVSFMCTTSRLVRERGQLDVVYLDLSKAFDVINHIIVLYKLSFY